MLSTVAQDVTAIAEFAIRYLQSEIEEKDPEEQGAAVQMSLVMRDSTAKPKYTQQGE